jgi:hypothetical protein
MRKLYGAAARAHAKKMGRRKSKRRNSPRKKGRKSPKRRAAARKAARTRASKHARRSRAAKRAWRKRAHKSARRTLAAYSRRRPRRRRKTSRAWRKHYKAYTANPRKRRRSKRRRSSSSRRRRRNPRRTTQRSMLRARRSIRNRYKTPLARATKRRYRMRSNPGIKGGLKGLVDLGKQVLPVFIMYYGSKALARQLAPRLPGFDRIPAKAQGPVMAGLVTVGAHFATKTRFLKRWRFGIMMGAGLNLFDSVFAAIAPAQVKSLFGMGEYVSMGDIYDTGLSEYMSVGATPIDDDITLSDYVEVGVEEELGLEEELGVEEELGGTSLDRAYLGGVSRDSMLRHVPQQRLISPIPERSFTREVRRAGPGYDNADVLYGGIFAGGYGG